MRGVRGSHVTTKWKEVTCSWQHAWLIALLSFWSAHVVTNRKLLATVRLWAQHGSRRFCFFWAQGFEQKAHLLWARQVVLIFQCSFIEEQEISGLCVLSYLVREKKEKRRKSANNECLSYTFSCLVNWGSCICIHRTYINTVYCCYGQCKQHYIFYVTSWYADEFKTIWTIPASFHL